MLWVLKKIVLFRLNETVLFEHPKHMFKLMGKETNAIFRSTNDPHLELCHYMKVNIVF